MHILKKLRSIVNAAWSGLMVCMGVVPEDLEPALGRTDFEKAVDHLARVSGRGGPLSAPVLLITAAVESADRDEQTLHLMRFFVECEIGMLESGMESWHGCQSFN
jgi:hypothetical protein